MLSATHPDWLITSIARFSQIIDYQLAGHMGWISVPN